MVLRRRGADGPDQPVEGEPSVLARARQEELGEPHQELGEPIQDQLVQLARQVRGLQAQLHVGASAAHPGNGGDSGDRGESSATTPPAPPRDAQSGDLAAESGLAERAGDRVTRIVAAAEEAAAEILADAEAEAATRRDLAAAEAREAAEAEATEIRQQLAAEIRDVALAALSRVTPHESEDFARVAEELQQGEGADGVIAGAVVELKLAAATLERLLQELVSALTPDAETLTPDAES